MSYGQFAINRQNYENNPNWVQEPYPPRHYDELRLTSILERIEGRLIAIEKRLEKLDALR
jgi:hypothetical protein